VARLKDTVREAKKRCRELRKHQTPAEERFWDLVRDRKLCDLKFYRQHPLFVELDGRTRFFIADFYCHECNLAIEIDGAIHEKQKEQDEYRERILNMLGTAVLRFANSDIFEDPERVRTQLLKHREHTQAREKPLPFSS